MHESFRRDSVGVAEFETFGGDSCSVSETHPFLVSLGRMIMRAATVFTLAALAMGISANDVHAGAKLLKKKLGVASFELHNWTAPFGVRVQLKHGYNGVVYDANLEPGDQELTEQTVGKGTPFVCCVTPLVFGVAPIEVEIQEPAADECVHVDVTYDQWSGELAVLVGEFECSEEELVDEVSANSVRESIAIAGSTSGLLLLAFAGSLFGRARRPEEDLPTAE